jgi:hypothetical protein
MGIAHVEASAAPPARFKKKFLNGFVSSMKSGCSAEKTKELPTSQALVSGRDRRMAL